MSIKKQVETTIPPNQLTEEQYAVIINHDKIEIVRDILEKVIPNSDGVIMSEELQFILGYISKWASKLSNKIHVEGDIV